MMNGTGQILGQAHKKRLHGNTPKSLFSIIHSLGYLIVFRYFKKSESVLRMTVLVESMVAR
jgi:hypothetical protein